MEEPEPLASHGSRKPPAVTSPVHAYAASFGEDLARELIVGHTRPGQVVLDPFAGSATTLRQARLLDRKGIGIDVDPVACLIARVTNRQYTAGELEELERHVLARLPRIQEHLGEYDDSATLLTPGPPSA